MNNLIKFDLSDCIFSLKIDAKSSCQPDRWNYHIELLDSFDLRTRENITDIISLIRSCGKMSKVPRRVRKVYACFVDKLEVEIAYLK